jgi:hypothetical protein
LEDLGHCLTQFVEAKTSASANSAAQFGSLASGFRDRFGARGGDPRGNNARGREPKKAHQGAGRGDQPVAIIAETIARIKAEGYEIFLVLDATIGFQRQDEAESESESRPAMVAAKGKTTEPKFQVTAQDLKFLKSMRIGLGE